MAKSNGFFGKRRGSVGSLTFSVRNGKQITREKVSSVRNPKTQYQANQRMIMGAATKFQAALKGILNHSFEGIAYGDASLRYFASHAMKGEGFLVGLQKGAYGFYPENYLISRGQLTTNGATCESGDGTLPLVGDATDIADFVSKNPRFQVGDQITVVAICNKYQRNVAEYTDPANFFVVVDRVILNDTLSNLALVKTEDEKFTLDLTSNVDNITENVTGQGDICALAVITSRMDELDGKWLRSTEYMYGEDFVNTTQLAQLNADALASYMQAGANMRSDRYLNQAEAPQEASMIYTEAVQMISPGATSVEADAVLYLGVKDSEGVYHAVVNGAAAYSGDATTDDDRFAISEFRVASEPASAVAAGTSWKICTPKLAWGTESSDAEVINQTVILGAPVNYVDIANFLFAQ